MKVQREGRYFQDLFYYIENKKGISSVYFNAGTVMITHLFLSLIGIGLLLNIDLSLWETAISWVVLFPYLYFMRNKMDVPWILYDKSIFSKKVRTKAILIFVGTYYLILPLII